MKTALAALVLTCFITADAGEVYDLGRSKTVPDWAVGPSLVIPVERFHVHGFKFERNTTDRIGTIQANYLELSGQRYQLASIELSEIPNGSKHCDITTVPKDGCSFKISLSQGLFDQTYYYVLVEKTDAATGQKVETQPFPKQLVVWDIKSR